MKTQFLISLFVVGAVLTASAKEKVSADALPEKLAGWLELDSGLGSFSLSENNLHKTTRQVTRGTLLPVLKTKERHGVTLGEVKALNLETGVAALGWMELKPGNLKPAESYPPDSGLLRLLGGPYLDDFTAKHTDIARFLVRRTTGPPLLLCYVLTAPMATAKLVVFTPNAGNYLPGASLDYPISEMPAGITSLEIDDLLGDGSDCIISKERFREQAQTYGTNQCIRRISNGRFQLLWQAPIEFHCLDQYPPQLRILQPPEQNIGAPATVTTGKVTFHANGKRRDPVWKGKVEFFAFGREQPVDSVSFEKTCPWNGQSFAPLR